MADTVNLDEQLRGQPDPDSEPDSDTEDLTQQINPSADGDH